MYKKLLYCAFVLLACAGYVPRASYSIRTLYVDSRLSARSLGDSVIAVLPLLGADGPVAFEEPENMTGVIQGKRPDLKFASGSEFEKGFPLRFDRREIAEFYKALFAGEILAAKGMDNIWESAGHPYFLAFSLADGALMLNRDSSAVRQVSLRGELWRRGDREVIWRAECKGVSEDGSVDDRGLIMESMWRLAEELPSKLPDYGRENW